MEIFAVVEESDITASDGSAVDIARNHKVIFRFTLTAYPLSFSFNRNIIPILGIMGQKICFAASDFDVIEHYFGIFNARSFQNRILTVFKSYFLFIKYPYYSPTFSVFSA